MAPKIDPDDLVDAGEAAELLGLAHRQAVSTYSSRYPDFPAPLIKKNSGKCSLWLRQDIEAWANSRPNARAEAPEPRARPS